jgi:NADH:ubiquinone oxidoreductase subunit B-like Fe-S oxidoreductase
MFNELELVRGDCGAIPPTPDGAADALMLLKQFAKQERKAQEAQERERSFRQQFEESLKVEIDNLPIINMMQHEE